MGQSLGQTGGQILDAVKAKVGQAWDDWSDDEKQLVADCAADAPAVGVLAIAGDPAAPREKAQIDAQLANIGSAGGATARAVFWPTVVEVLEQAAGVGLKVLLA